MSCFRPAFTKGCWGIRKSSQPHAGIFRASLGAFAYAQGSEGSLWRPSESTILQHRVEESSKWAAWAPQLVAYIQQSMLDWQQGEAHAKREDMLRSLKLQMLAAEMDHEGPVHAEYSAKKLKKGMPKRSNATACWGIDPGGRIARRVLMRWPFRVLTDGCVSPEPVH